MKPVNYLPSFRGDLEEIWLHIAHENIAAADQLVDDLYERCLMLQAHPHAGLIRADIAPDCRQLVFGGYVVLYRIRTSRIELVRVLHGRRNIAAKHFDPP